MHIRELPHIQKQRLNSRSYFFLLLSFLAMMVVPLLLLSLGYIYTSRTLKEETMDTQQALMEQLQTQLDADFSNIASGNKVLAESNMVQQFAVLPQEYTPADLFDLNDLQDELSSRNAYSTCGGETYVYLSQSRLLVTGDYIYDSGTLYAFTSCSYGMEEADFIALLTEDYIGYTTEKLVQLNGKPYALFLQKIYNTQQRNLLGVVATSVPLQAAVSSLSGSDWGSQADYYLVTVDSALYIGQSTPLFSSLSPDPADFYSQSSRAYLSIETGKSLICGVPSHYNKWYYCILVSQKTILHKLFYFRIFIGVDLLLSLLIGCVLALRLSSYYYTPIRKLLTTMQQNRKAVDDSSESFERVFASIEQTFTDLVRDNQTAEHELYRRQNLLYGNLMMELCSGRVQEPDAIIRLAADSQVTLREDDVVVLIFSLCDAERSIFCDHEEGEMRINYDLLYFSLCNVINEMLFTAPYTGFCSEYNNTLVTVVQRQKPSAGTLGKRIQSILDFAEEVFHLRLAAAVSEIGCSLHKLSFLYRQTDELSQYQQFWRDEVEQILFTVEMKVDQPMESINRLQETRQFLNCLVLNDYDAAHQLLTKQLDEGFVKDPRYLQVNKRRMYGIISSILDVLLDEQEDAFYQELAASQKLLSVKTMGELRSATDEVFARIIRYNEKKKENDQPEWVEQVEQYIRTHYQDPALDLTMVSQEMNISVYYLSRTFKKYVLMGVLDYIHVTRIAACKELLSKGVTVKDAAEQVGYLDSKALIRAFKRYEGITPGQFKGIAD